MLNSEIRRAIYILLTFFCGCSVALLVIGHRQAKWARLALANACVTNLRQIEAASKLFASKNYLTNGAPINFPDDLTPYIKLNSQGKIPGCPGDGIYSIKKVGDAPTCSLGTTVTPAHVLP
jgi:hypothetical protein